MAKTYWLAKVVFLNALAAVAQAQNTTLRYMPFGDSITEIVCCRAKLWEKLQTTEWGGVNWVGQDGEQLQGHQTNPADVITMHLSTNDIVQQNKAVTDIIAAFSTLVQVMRDSNPQMKIIVAQIIPMGIGGYTTQIQALNKAILPWAVSKNTTESPIWVVDQYTGFSGSSDLRDGVHPNDSGDTKMANVWYPALVNALSVAQASKGAARDIEVAFTA
ncbi:hypothetical protein LQW54_005437 [Pestalotiopsis sp. IQ-011]